MYARLEEVLGAEHAGTLMTYLPPHPAEEVATKDDVAMLRQRLDHLEARFDRLEARFDGMHDRLDGIQRTFIGATIGSMTAMTAIFSIIVALLR